MSAFISAEELLRLRRKTEIIEISIPGYDGNLCIRNLSEYERLTAYQYSQSAVVDGQIVDHHAMLQFLTYVFQLCCVEPDGNRPLLSVDEVKSLPIDFVSMVCEKIMNHSNKCLSGASDNAKRSGDEAGV